jgi:GT2 family glycosyltransferase
MILSVIIATMNRSADLERALLSLGSQARLPDEVIIVDQSRDDATRVLCERFNAGGALMGRLRYLPQSQPSLVAARNRGVSSVKGEIVGFLDDDVVLLPDYYQRILAALEADAHLGAVGGCVLNTPFGGVRWRLRQGLATAFLLNFWNGRMTPSGFGYPIYHRAITRPTRVDMLHGCNMTFRSQALRGEAFDTWFSGYSYREDAEFTYRISKRWKILMIPEARLYHNESTSNRLDRRELRSMRMRSYEYVWRKHKGPGSISSLLFRYSVFGLHMIEQIEAYFQTRSGRTSGEAQPASPKGARAEAKEILGSDQR